MTNKTLRFLIVRVILYVALLPYMTLVAKFLLDNGIKVYGKFFFHKTYVKSINLPSYPKAKAVLEEFNRLGDNKVVSFDEIKDGRPIEITEMDEYDRMFYSEAVGIATPRLTQCHITIRKGMSDVEFRETLIHEYLHCYGYMHTNDEKDLMYAYLVLVNKDENIKQYAQKLKREFYE